MTRGWMVAAAAVLLIQSALVAEAGGAAPRAQEPQLLPLNIGNLNDWVRRSKLAEIRDGMLQLDALRVNEPVAVFLRDKPFENVKLTVQFNVEPVGTGERAIGLIFGSTDSENYYCFYLNRREGRLYRVALGRPWKLLDHRGGLEKDEGKWHVAQVECTGEIIRVFFAGKLLFATNAPDLRPGWVGVLAKQSRLSVRHLGLSGKPARMQPAWGLVE